MKTSFVAFAALASVAYAQLDNLPQCALSCFVTALSTGDCELTDFACQCQRTELVPTVQPCIREECTPEEEAEIITVVEGVCADAGQPITIEGPSAETTPTPTSATESAPASETPSASESTEIMPSITDVPTTSVESTPAETPAPSTSFTGAAAMATGMGGFAVAVVAGAAALL